MNFKKCKKGEYGYLAYKKTYETIYFSILALIIISVFVAGIIINHTRKNLYTVIAILIVLPAAKVLVNLIMLYRFKSMDTGEYNKITQYEKNNIILYDMPLSTPDCIIFAPIILIREKEVFIYNLNKIKSPDKCESYIKNFARNDAVNIKVKFVSKDTILKLLKEENGPKKDLANVINIFSILHI